jgi:hypothetical protein
MAVGGPQGIDVTRILARNWMSIPTYTDTPAAPLTGTPWPARGFIIHVAKSGDTAVWQYTGKKWAKIGGFAENNYTYLESGGSYSTFPATNVVLVRPATYYIQGTKYNSSPIVLIGFPKAANANGRIDAITLGTTGPGIIQGEESNKPSSPSIPANKLKIGFIYYAPFDTLAKVTGNELTSAFRIPGRDSIYFTSGDTTIAVKDSIGISRTDTSSMLTNYVNTASNGLTKVGKDIRLGGTLNQQTRIALGGNGINIVGSADSSRFFGNGSVAVGYRVNQNPYPDDSTYRFAVNGTSRLNGVVTYKGDLLPQNTPNAYTLGITQGSSFGAIRAYKNNGATSIQQIELGDNATGLNTAGTLSSPSAANYGFRVYGNNSAVDSGGGSYTNFRISPSINYSTNFKKAIHMGLSYEPTVSSLNNTTHIAFRNTRGSNLFNVNSGNTLIGYDTTSAAYQVDTTFKLDVNGSAMVRGILRTTASSLNNASVIMNGNNIPANEASLVWGGNGLNLPSNTGIQNVVISPTGTYSSITGGYNTLIGRAAGVSNSSGNWNVLVGADAGNGITNGSHNTIIGGTLNALSPNYSRTIQLISGGYENARPDSSLADLIQNFAFIGGGDDGQVDNQPSYINDYYFGGGHRIRLARFGDVNFYAPSAQVRTDSVGANFTINAGRGTGTGLGGSVIFRTSTPTTSGTTLQTLSERARISPAGNLLVGRTVDSIYKLDVNGTGRFSGSLYQTMGTQSINLLNSTLQAPQTSDRGTFIGNGSYNNSSVVGVAIGVGTTLGTGTGNVAIGYTANASGGGIAISAAGQPTHASNGGLAIGGASTANSSISIGGNSSNSGVAIYGTATGVGSVAVGYVSSATGNHSIALGDRCSSPNSNSIAIGLSAKTTANNQLVFGGNDVSNAFGIRDIYFGSGVRNESKFSGIDYTINGSGAGDSSNIAGGSITIAGGKGTGSGTPGDVIFSTTNTLSTPADSTTLQTLAQRVVVKGGTGNLLVGTTTDVPSSKLTVTSTTQGFLQPRITNTQRDAISTPAQGLQVFSTTDSANYVYRGTGGGWQKIANEISGSATLDFPSTGHGNSADLTITVTGASEGDVVALGIPNASIVANASFTAWVSATNTVKVRFNNYAGSGSSDPASGTFKIKVFK